jgi:HEPN domain-containing protein
MWSAALSAKARSCMSAPEHAKALLSIARKDADALRGMIGNPLFADEIFGFHAQQAIEKALKAWLASLSVDFPLTHDLSRLLGLLEDTGAEMADYWPLVEFTVYAVQARYEAGLLEAEEPLNRVDVTAEVERLLVKVATLIA